MSFIVIPPQKSKEPRQQPDRSSAKVLEFAVMATTEIKTLACITQPFGHPCCLSDISVL